MAGPFGRKGVQDFLKMSSNVQKNKKYYLFLFHVWCKEELVKDVDMLIGVIELW